MVVFGLLLASGVMQPPVSRAEEPPATGKPFTITVSKPDGWTFIVDQQMLLHGMGFRSLTSTSHPSLKVIVAAYPADGVTVNQRAMDIKQLCAADGLQPVEFEEAADGRTIATGFASGKLKDGLRHSARYGVRSPKGRPDLLLIITATWTGNLPPPILEQLDLLILTATVK